MIRTTDEGTFVWFQLATKTSLKITWPLELWLAHAKLERTEADYRAALFNEGATSHMTPQDYLDCNIKVPGLKLAAAAGAMEG